MLRVLSSQLSFSVKGALPLLLSCVEIEVLVYMLQNNTFESSHDLWRSVLETQDKDILTVVNWWSFFSGDVVEGGFFHGDCLLSMAPFDCRCMSDCLICLLHLIPVFYYFFLISLYWVYNLKSLGVRCLSWFLFSGLLTRMYPSFLRWQQLHCFFWRINVKGCWGPYWITFTS